jgi:hypothetical protein
VLFDEVKKILLGEYAFTQAIKGFGNSAGSEGCLIGLVDFFDANDCHGSM